MRHLVAFPRPFEHARQVAVAFAEQGSLSAYATGFVWPERLSGRRVRRILERVGAAGAVARRTIVDLPRTLVRSFPVIDVGRTAASALRRYGLEDRLWERDDHRFPRLVAERLLDGCDVVHGCEHASLELFDAAHRAGKRTVLHVASLHPAFHDAILDREYARYPELKDSVDFELRERRAPRDRRRLAEYASADLLIVSSSLSRQLLIEHGIPEDRIEVVHLGAPDVPATAGNAGTRTRTAGTTGTGTPGTSPLTVLYVGKVSVAKGCHVLLHAWTALGSRDARLVMVGRNQLPASVRVPPRVEMLGSLPHAAVLDRMPQFDVVVLPTLCDSFGVVILEALQRGVPVITTANAGAADLVEEGENGWIVAAGDAEALTERLAWCERHVRSVRAMRAQVRRGSRPRTWPDFRRDVRDAVAQRGWL
jgi:glycosyltransferase involved in cell wall biosynthesis